MKVGVTPDAGGGATLTGIPYHWAKVPRAVALLEFRVPALTLTWVPSAIEVAAVASTSVPAPVLFKVAATPPSFRAPGVKVLVTEATFSEEERRRAEETKHQTATQAAQLAQRANVGMLALTHLSNRYFGPEIAREAREIFPETVVPRDFDVIEVPFAERGTPQLLKGGAARRREQEVVSSAPQ